MDAAYVAVDADGNLYFSDSVNSRIRRVSNGVITTVAGNGTQGSSGDNGPATSAQLNGPFTVAVDAAGNLYVADRGNDSIRILIPSGASCSASVTPLTLSTSAADGSLTVTIQTGSSCVWAIQGRPDWITFSESAVATGPGEVTLNVAANSGRPRTATVSIAGISVSVTQQGHQLQGSASGSSISSVTSQLNPSQTPGGQRVVEQAKLISQPGPEYPPLARQARVQGTVRFFVVVGADGSVQQANLVYGHPFLIPAAQEAVKRYVYEPRLSDGKPLAFVTLADVVFVLAEQ